MKVLIGRGSCRIVFDKEEEKYFGKTLSLGGEGNKNEFWISKSEGIYWSVQNAEHPNRYIGIPVDEVEKEAIVAYVIEKSKEQGYIIYL